MDPLNILGLVLGLTFIALGLFTARAEAPPGPKWLAKYEECYVPVARWLSVALFTLVGMFFAYSSLHSIFANR